jgi:hypothetical protein
MRPALAWVAGIFATIVLSAQTATTLVIRGRRQHTYVYGPSTGSPVTASRTYAAVVATKDQRVIDQPGVA